MGVCKKNNHYNILEQILEHLYITNFVHCLPEIRKSLKIKPILKHIT